jgi:hypothetical protein
MLSMVFHRRFHLSYAVTFLRHQRQRLVGLGIGRCHAVYDFEDSFEQF